MLRIWTLLWCLLPVALYAQGNKIEIRVLVTAPEGSSISQIAVDDLEVEHRGRGETVTKPSVYSKPPLRVGLVLDHSGSARRSALHPILLDGALRWAKAAVERYGGDAFLVGFNDQIITSTDAVTEVPALRQSLSQMRVRGGSAVHDALVHSSQKFSSLRPESAPTARVILLVSDGADNASNSTEKRALESAQMSGVRIYAIVFPSTDARLGKAKLKRICERTGGKAFFPENETEVRTVLRALDEDLANTILLGFTPPVCDGKFHRIRLRLAGKEISRLRYTDQYWVPHLH